MRGLVLFAGILAALGIALPYPYVGVLLWSWFTLQQPHQDAYGFVQTAHLNLVIAIVTLGAWLLSRERKAPPGGAIFWLFVIFLAWMTFNSFYAVNPGWSWPYWHQTWKTFLLGSVIATMASSRVRLYALIWIAVISLFYYGVKGGIFTILTGGNFHVFGPPSTIIGDNNQLAVALLMVLPLANYLRSQVADKRIKHILLLGMILTVIAIVGTYSRGAMIGMGALMAITLLRARNRILYISTIAVAALLIANFMPAHFFDRMNTISTASQDASFQERLYSWKVAFLYASDHFPFGAGFYGPQLGVVYQHYFPDRQPYAAHSIYFQVLGEHGFIGLGIYLMIIVAAVVRCTSIIRMTRGVPHYEWVHDLAVAIQSSLFVFCVAGAALSMAYYDLFIIDVAMLLPLRQVALVEKTVRLANQRSATARYGSLQYSSVGNRSGE